MSFVILIFIPIIRFLSVSILPLIYKLTGRPFPLAKAERRFFWYTGLIRGIIAFALSLQIISPNRSYLRTVSFMVVIFTTVVGSTFLNKFCQLIGLGEIGLMKTGEVREEDKEIELVPSTKYGMIGVIDDFKERDTPAHSDRLQLLE
jgi:NhaP-type Na+/H+ or K+/H+ antiporter